MSRTITDEGRRAMSEAARRNMADPEQRAKRAAGIAARYGWGDDRWAELRRLLDDGLNPHAIAQRMGVKRDLVLRKMRQKEWKACAARAEDAGDGVIREMWQTTARTVEIRARFAEVTGRPISKAGIYKRAEALGLPKRDQALRIAAVVQARQVGSQSQREEWARAILEKMAMGMTARDAAAAAGVGWRMVRRLREKGFLPATLGFVALAEKNRLRAEENAAAMAPKIEAALKSGLTLGRALKAAGCGFATWRRLRDAGVVKIDRAAERAKWSKPGPKPLPRIVANDQPRPVAPAPRFQTAEEWERAGGVVKRLPAAVVAPTQARLSEEDRAQLAAYTAARGGYTRSWGNWRQQKREGRW